MGDYVVSLASLAVTMAAFMCVVFISLPWNKVRLLTIFIAATLAVVSAAIDYTYLQGYLLDVELPETWIDLAYVLSAVGISCFVNLIFRKIFKELDRKYGDRFEEYVFKTSLNLKEKFSDLGNKIKDAFKRS